MSVGKLEIVINVQGLLLKGVLKDFIINDEF